MLEKPFTPAEPKTLSYDDHVTTFEQLTTALHAGITDTERGFLLSFEAGDPDWTAVSISGAAELPAVQWKLLNVRKLRDSNAEKHAQMLLALERALQG